MKKSGWAFVIALTVALLTGLAHPASASAAVAGKADDVGIATADEVRNTGSVGVGAIEFWQGRGYIYRQGWHDAVIPGGRRSGFASTDGFYVGPTHCLRLRGWMNPIGTILTDPDIAPPGQWVFVAGYYGFDIRAVELGNPLCDHPSPNVASSLFAPVQ